MTGEWTAVTVRARALASRRVGSERARSLALAGSLEAALATLEGTPYGVDLHVGMDLAGAGRAIWSTLLWHLRILAGWSPSRGMDRVRLLAAGFEIANILGRLSQLEGRPSAPPFVIGTLETAWGAVGRAQSAEDVRRVLAGSGWGDPGSTEMASVGMALQAAWARRVAYGVPEARPWARLFASLLVARMRAVGIVAEPRSTTERNLRLTVGSRSVSTSSWISEARAWRSIEEQALAMAIGFRPGPGAVVAVAGLLAADAWRTRAALELAARGGTPSGEELDAVA